MRPEHEMRLAVAKVETMFDEHVARADKAEAENAKLAEVNGEQCDRIAELELRLLEAETELATLRKGLAA